LSNRMVQAPSDFDLVDALDKLRIAIDADLARGQVVKPNEFIATFQTINGPDTDKKSASDQTLKLLLQTRLSSARPAAEIVTVLQYGTAAARKGLCSIMTPFLMIADALDCSTLENCQIVFDFVEKHTAIWKSSQFYASGKNSLLRACNDLLRRLSQSQNNVFCGRIHIFLTRIFPISEKSALNLNSNFNLDNETKYDEKVEGETDQALYESIWKVQDVFRAPNGIYETEKYKQFEEAVNKITDTFKNYKLEGNESLTIINDEQQQQQSESMDKDAEKHVYFPKFLTSSSLTELQLSDPSFRRQILTQLLFLFQYLNGYVKFRPATNVLPFSQREWVKGKEKEIYTLLNETPPAGAKYTKFIKHVLEREGHWVKWKNEGCQKFMKEKEADKTMAAPPVKKRRTLYDDIMNGRKIGLGSPELTKLWGKSESNLDACKTPKRQFIPTVEEYFEEAIMHSDPKNEIEDSFKCYLDPSYGWRSLRLLAHSSPLFFSLQPTTMHHLPVPKYLEHIFKRLRKETKKDETEQVEVDSKGDNEFENEKEETTAPGTPVRDEKTGLLTNDQVDDLAMQLEDKWEDLANELRHIKSEDIKSIKKDAEDNTTRARIAITTWQDKNGAEATKEIMVETLTAIGLEEIAGAVFGAEKMEE